MKTRKNFLLRKKMTYRRDQKATADSVVFPLCPFSTEVEGGYARPVRVVLSTLPAFAGLAFGETQIIRQ